MGLHAGGNVSFQSVLVCCMRDLQELGAAELPDNRLAGTVRGAIPGHFVELSLVSEGCG